MLNVILVFQLKCDVECYTCISADNRLKQPRRREKQDYSLFNPEEDSGSKMSPQLAMAALQFLSTGCHGYPSCCMLQLTLLDRAHIVPYILNEKQCSVL